MNNKTIKQVTRYFGYTLSFIGVTILAIVVTLISTVYLLCKGPSTKAKEDRTNEIYGFFIYG